MIEILHYLEDPKRWEITVYFLLWVMQDLISSTVFHHHWDPLAPVLQGGWVYRNPKP